MCDEHTSSTKGIPGSPWPVSLPQNECFPCLTRDPALKPKAEQYWKATSCFYIHAHISYSHLHIPKWRHVYTYIEKCLNLKHIALAQKAHEGCSLEHSCKLGAPKASWYHTVVLQSRYWEVNLSTAECTHVSIPCLEEESSIHFSVWTTYLLNGSSA